MKCKSCDDILTDFESPRRSLVTGEYLTLCQRCFAGIKDDVLAFGNPKLMTEDDDDQIVDQLEIKFFKDDPFDDLDDDLPWSDR